MAKEALPFTEHAVKCHQFNLLCNGNLKNWNGNSHLVLQIKNK
jgi:hypothetical protein